MPSTADNFKVFISYSHDSQELMDTVLALSDRLRTEGIDCIIDQYETSPSEGWARWCDRQIEEADFVLVVCTEMYERRFKGVELPGKGKGAIWEGAIITRQIYEAQARNKKFIPVIFTPDDGNHIPIILRSATYFTQGTEKGYESLYRYLTNQPRIPKPVLGKLEVMPARSGENISIPEFGTVLSKTIKKPAKWNEEQSYDVFLSHSHLDSEVVEELAKRLVDNFGLNVWIDKWILVPGEKWQKKMAQGLDEAKSCAVCIGKETPKGWFQEEIERAINRQTKDDSFRVIPVLLPNAQEINIDNFLELRTWVDLKNGLNDSRALHILVSGIKGVAPMRNTQEDIKCDPIQARRKLIQIQMLYNEGRIDPELKIEYDRKILDQEILMEK